MLKLTFWKQNGIAKMPTPMMLLANVIIYPVFELIFGWFLNLYKNKCKCNGERREITDLRWNKYYDLVCARQLVFVEMNAKQWRVFVGTRHICCVNFHWFFHVFSAVPFVPSNRSMQFWSKPIIDRLKKYWSNFFGKSTNMQNVILKLH